MGLYQDDKNALVNYIKSVEESEQDILRYIRFEASSLIMDYDRANLMFLDMESDLSKTKILDPSHFIEVSKSGITTYFTVVCQNKYQKLSLLIENENMKGKWEGLFMCYDNHTTLDFSEDVVSKKLILRPFIKRYLRKQQSLYVVDLIKALDCREIGKNQIFMETGGVKQ